MPRHIFANIGRNKPRRVIWAAILKVWLLATSRGIVGFAEIGEADQHNERRRIRRIFGRPWSRDRAGWGTRVPIVFNGALWKEVEQKKTRLSPGVRGVSPPRELIEVLLENRLTGSRVVRLNTHWIAGAWNGRHQRAQQLRDRYWADAMATTTERVHYWHDRGYDVVISGDFNRQRPPRFHGKQVTAVAHSTDAILAIPGPGRRVKVGKTKTRRLGIDFHRALVAKISFTKD